ncbi:MAG: HaeIII family restriction endonuclease [Rhodobacteraceae bacterium]|nr:HaeIII family restriction endonuclease [Paracoccaceae bacterium]
MARQVANGHAYEYAIASAFRERLGCGIAKSAQLARAKDAYTKRKADFQRRIDSSAHGVCAFLVGVDQRLSQARVLTLQPSASGKEGDARDIVMDCNGDEVGLSAKHNHGAMKHPRLSGKIDFGKQWGGCAVSRQYWHAVRPIFADLEKKASQGVLFRQIKDKPATIYLPVLNAFEDELRRLCRIHGQGFIKGFFRYLIGRHDFYKVTCYSHRRQSAIESINMNGTLPWGTKWRVPENIQSIARQQESQSTLLVTFEGGWQIKFRLHSASSRVEPSLKFDVGFLGMSRKVGRHTLAIPPLRGV